MKLLTDMPRLPLTDEQRLNGLVRVIEQKSTSLGRALVDYFETKGCTGSALTRAQKVIKEDLLVHISRDGHISVGKTLGFPISTDQLIEHQTLSDSYPEASFYFLVRIRTFSFSCTEFDEVQSIFNAAKSLGVCLTLRNMYLSCLDYKKPSAFGQYLIEIVTTSQMSMIFKVMRHAKTDAYETLRECSLTENKFVATHKIEEQIEAVELSEIENRIKWTQKK